MVPAKRKGEARSRLGGLAPVLWFLAVCFSCLALDLAQGAQLTDTCNGYRLPAGKYGEPKDGAAAFAPLVGVACDGSCHADALSWGGAVGPPKAIFNPVECHTLCQELGDECEVWQWKKKEK